MAYLLDTNHCIYLMNGWNKPKNKITHQERNTLERFNKAVNEVIYMCEASVGELRYGIEKSERKEYNLKKFNILLLAVPPIPVTREVWEIYGETKAELSKIGRVIPDIDLLIASTAKRYDLISILKNIPASVSSAVKRQGDEGSDFNPGMPDSYSGLILFL